MSGSPKRTCPASSRPGTVCTQKQGGRRTMSSATITASAKTRVVSDRQPDSAPTLHVAFLSEDGGRAAQCAAHLTRGLANDALEVEAASFDDADVVLPQDDAGASLTIVLHTLGAPAPMLVEDNGGRIDWYAASAPVGTGCGQHPG